MSETEIVQRSFLIDSCGTALAATIFLPPVARGAVLLIPPLVEERKGVLPIYAQCARELAANGVVSLLFDLSGSGDSQGEFEQQQPTNFSRDCTNVWLWLKQSFPQLPKAVLGTRIGALLALELARQEPDVKACALWAPVTGVDFIRQLLQRRMVNDMVAYGKARATRHELEAQWQRGEVVDLDGYRFSSALHAWLQTLVVGEAAPPNAIFCAAGGRDVKTAAGCVGSGTTATLRFPPFWNTVGHVDVTELVRTTIDWLCESLGTEPTAVATAAPAMTVSRDDFAVRFAALGQVGEISAIFDLPHGPPKAGVLLLHGWSGDRTGPHRLFTHYARTLAQGGVLTVRPDFFGRGLSGGTPTQASIARMTADAQCALDALRAALPPQAPISVVAICSGCKVAIMLAAENPTINKLILWSAESMGSLRSRATRARKTHSALLTYVLKLMQPATWRKILQGRVHTGLVVKVLTKQETRSTQEAAQEDEALEHFRAFRNPVLFVFGGSDPDAPGSSAAYRRYCEKHNIPWQIHSIDHAGHSFYGSEWKRELLAVTARFYESE